MFNLPLRQKYRQILHIDADAFFASVEQILNPKLRGKPLLVGHVPPGTPGASGANGTGQHGIVSAASYEARPFGIYAGMPMYLARKKCPQAAVVQGHFEAYRDFSRRMYQIMIRHTPDVEMCSIDEAYLDITGCAEAFGETPELFAKMILMEIYGKLGLSVSCGMASNKTVAKVASGLNKPHKLTVVPHGSEARFLAPLELREIPGIGPRTSALLERHCLKKVGDLSALTSEEVLKKLGIHGIPLWKRALGIDNSPVIASISLPKSISKEHTFYRNSGDKVAASKCLKDLSVIVFSKLRSHKLKAGLIFVKIRYKTWEEGRQRFEDFTFQKNLDFPSDLDSKLFPSVKELFLKNLLPSRGIRLIGLGVGRLFQNYNLSLFENDEEESKLFASIDALKKLYGEDRLRYGI